MVRLMEQSRDQTETRLKEALRQQSEAADANEQLLFMVGGLLGLVLVVVLLVVLIRKVSSSRPAPAPGLLRPTAGANSEASEYVLDGRDEDGIRYLLRISGDQLIDDAGVVIGRNPKDSLYIITKVAIRNGGRWQLDGGHVFRGGFRVLDAIGYSIQGPYVVAGAAMTQLLVETQPRARGFERWNGITVDDVCGAACTHFLPLLWQDWRTVNSALVLVDNPY